MRENDKMGILNRLLELKPYIYMLLSGLLLLSFFLVMLPQI